MKNITKETAPKILFSTTSAVTSARWLLLIYIPPSRLSGCIILLRPHTTIIQNAQSLGRKAWNCAKLHSNMWMNMSILICGSSIWHRTQTCEWMCAHIYIWLINMECFVSNTVNGRHAKLHGTFRPVFTLSAVWPCSLVDYHLLWWPRRLPGRRPWWYGLRWWCWRSPCP